MSEQMVACQVCTKKYPAQFLRDVRGSFPGGRKETCPECYGMLNEREICAKIAEGVIDDEHIGVCDPGECAACDRGRAASRAIRARTAITKDTDPPKGSE